MEIVKMFEGLSHQQKFSWRTLSTAYQSLRFIRLKPSFIKEGV
ncbi:hypothetical protein TCARB_0764 [Thermofilum adornatum 1505]|uniref:Uncharacterized protein n=1 Tax=Thermofilum adornatum 1505 TaxID=697581 RepID=A0A3G1A501_9CREN|nr:hypothetical protein [Thermofilum adornatum]AJB41816.1 hypothetical protein TCARB_0764 [Thermofilum adornatum 1505]